MLSIKPTTKEGKHLYRREATQVILRPLYPYQKAMQLTLLIPELIWPEPGDHDTLDALACTALSTLIARGQCVRRAPQSLEATLTDAFDLPEGAPYGALRLLGESTAPEGPGTEGNWLCADPVHLRFQQDRLILADSGTFGIELDEAHAIAGELNRHFSDIGRFHIAAADRWYLQLAASSKLLNFDVPPLSAIAGRRVEQQLPQTTQTAGLRKVLNEAQMVLHGHAINTTRESAGRMPINSLWLWGAGALPQGMASHFDGVWSNNPLACGLGRAAGVPTHAVPADAALLLANLAADTHHLVLLEDLLGPVQYQDGDAYRSALLALEERWFVPLRKALLAGKLKQLTLETSTAYGALSWKNRLTDQWKLWRRPQPLATIAQNLAKGSA
jgi:hypothetical protein